MDRAPLRNADPVRPGTGKYACGLRVTRERIVGEPPFGGSPFAMTATNAARHAPSPASDAAVVLLPPGSFGGGEKSEPLTHRLVP